MIPTQMLELVLLLRWMLTFRFILCSWNLVSTYSYNIEHCDFRRKSEKKSHVSTCCKIRKLLVNEMYPSPPCVNRYDMRTRIGSIRLNSFDVVRCFGNFTSKIRQICIISVKFCGHKCALVAQIDMNSQSESLKMNILLLS